MTRVSPSSPWHRSVDSLGSKNVLVVDPIMAAEDFAYFQQQVPGVYFFLGVANAAEGWTDYVHTPTFRPDEAAIVAGVKAAASLLADFTSQRSNRGRGLITRVAIVGGGITGLATGAWLEYDHGIDDYVILEASSRAGGKIRSELDAGFTLEWGPQGFLDNAPDTLELAAIQGLARPLVRADDAAADRFILRQGKAPPGGDLAGCLHAFQPPAPVSGRLRLLGEPFASPHPGHDETVFDFASRRIGRQAAEVLVDAMVTGVFAGDSRKLSLAATFPKMAAMESEHGSLTRALFAKMREARKTGSRSAGPSGPGGTLTTFSGGMVRLTDRLAREAPAIACCSIDRFETLERHRAGIHILNTDDGVIEAETILLALPAEGAAATARPSLHRMPSQPLAATPTAPIAVVMLGYNDKNAFGRPVSGFGFLVPRGEDDALLGTLYCHEIFPGQAPDRHRSFSAPWSAAHDRRRPPASTMIVCLTAVRASLARVFGADPEPDRVWIVRWEQGISQYTVGHLDRVAAAEAAAGKAGIELAGSPYRGVSVNDCIKQARAAARRIAQRLADTQMLRFELLMLIQRLLARVQCPPRQQRPGFRARNNAKVAPVSQTTMHVKF